MIRRAYWIDILRFVGYFGIGLIGLVTCWWLDSRLSGYKHHDRQFWEGVACALVLWTVLEIEYLVREGIAKMTRRSSWKRS